MASEKPTQSIFCEFNELMDKFGLPNKRWYVGVAADDQDCVQTLQQVGARNETSVWARSVDHREAQNIAMAFHYSGCKGSHGGGGKEEVYVYAYLIEAPVMAAQ